MNLFNSGFFSNLIKFYNKTWIDAANQVYFCLSKKTPIFSLVIFQKLFSEAYILFEFL